MQQFLYRLNTVVCVNDIHMPTSVQRPFQLQVYQNCEAERNHNSEQAAQRHTCMRRAA